MKNTMCVAVFLLAGLLAGMTMAQDFCEGRVVDQAGLFGGSLNQVRDAASKLSDVGADVRVRTLVNDGSIKNLDQYFQGLVRQCSAWQSTSGGRKSNLAAMVYAFNPLTQKGTMGIYTGSLWKRVADANSSRIVSEFTRPHTQHKEYSEAFIQGLGELHHVFYLQVHPPVAFPWGKIIIFAVLGLTLLVMISKLVSNKRSDKQHLDVLRQKAQSEKSKLANNTLSVDDPLIENQIENLKPRVSTEDYESVLVFWKVSKDLRAKASMDFGTLSADPADPRLTAEQLNQVRLECEEVQKTLDAANAKAEEAKEAAVRLCNIIDNGDELLAEVNGEIEHAQEQVNLLIKEGVDSSEVLDGLNHSRRNVSNAQAALSFKKYGKAYGCMNLASSFAKRIVEMVDRALLFKKYCLAVVETAEQDLTNAREYKSKHGFSTEAQSFLDKAEASLQYAKEALNLDQRRAFALTASSDARLAIEKSQPPLPNLAPKQGSSRPSSGSCLSGRTVEHTTVVVNQNSGPDFVDGYLLGQIAAESRYQEPVVESQVENNYAQPQQVYEPAPVDDTPSYDAESNISVEDSPSNDYSSSDSSDDSGSSTSEDD